ncbi:uncharacterized protein LOC134819430 [Bolinopsis microptera]|uniref:uncharacterized protein LOC134819430 n=1 Tax=Bolinopsis microptera TaxID=2820187 RepID=UPI00307A8A07
MWLWGTTIDRAVSAASQGSMYAKFEESEKEKAAKPKPSPWVTIGNVAAEVPMSSAGLPVTGAAANAEGIPGFDFDVMTQKPFRRNDLVDDDKEKKISEDRPMWTNRLEFILASMAAIWGIGNMGSFIYAMQEFGGGAFLIPYFIFYMMFSLPTLIMEMLIGQVYRRGVIVTMERIHKYFSGVGKSILFVTIIYNIYFNTTTAWTLYFAFKGMWAAIDVSGSYPGHGTCEEKGWTGSELSCCKSSNTLFHWYYEFLHISKGPLDLGDFKWYTTYDKFWPFIVIIFAWFLIGAFMCSGLWVKGKFPYISLVIPLVVFLGLFAKSLATWNLDANNVDEPVAKLLEIFQPDFAKLLDASTWMNAATQAFRVSLCGLGVFSTYSGYANPQYNLVKDGILISVWGMLAPLVTTLLLIPVASYYTVADDLKSLKELPTDFSLVFVIIPTVIQNLEDEVTGKTFGSIAVAVYFVTLLTLTMVTALAIGEVVLTTLMDIEFPNKFFPYEIPAKRITLSIVYSVLSCIIGLLFGLQNGAYLFEVLDQVIYPIPSMFIACAEVFAIAWIYSIYRFNDDVWLKCGYQIPILWQQYFSWVLPPGLFATFISEVYLQFNKSIVYPEYTTGNGTQSKQFVNYGYPALVDCNVSPDFRQRTEWPAFILFIQWALIIFCALWPIWSSLTYNAQTRENWRVYKHKRKYPLGIIYPVDNRGEWAFPQAYVIAQSGAAIGVGIITRFAYKYYAFGKYVFVIQCFIVHLLMSLPAFILEIDLGQVFRSGPISVWKKVHPSFAGVGWCCLFINLFQAVNYMYPTIQIIDYILQLINKMFLGKYSGLNYLVSTAISDYGSDPVANPLPSFIALEAQNNFPWNNCLYQLCDMTILPKLNIDCGTSSDSVINLANGSYEITDLNVLWEMVPDMCKYAPPIYQFQAVKLNYTGSLNETELYNSFSKDYESATDVFKEIKRLFIDDADSQNRYFCIGTFVFIACITAIKPSLRHILFGIQYIIPLFGIVIGSVYIALRGGANQKLVDMLFKLNIPEGETFSDHVTHLLSEPSNWAEAGVVTMTFHAIGTGVNIAFSSYNPRDNWVNLQGMVITCYAWLGNFMFMLFYFLNVVYMAEKTSDPVQRKIYGLEGRLVSNIDNIMDRGHGGSYLFMATLADSLSYHKHTMFVLPLMLLCVLLNSIGSIQAIVETMATSVYGAGFFPFSRIPSCFLVAALCALLSQVYALNSGFGFFMYQIFERFVYGWPVPILSAIMVIAGTWVYSMYRLNNAMFMYSMHHLHYYWMFVWPFITPMGMIGMAGFRGYLEYSKLLDNKLPYLGSQSRDYTVSPADANNTEVMKLYLVEAYWPEPILYVSCAIYIMYLAPFIFTFTLVGIVNCIRDFPCKPMCYDFYVEPEEEVEEEGLVISNIVQTPRQALEANDDDNVSIGGMSVKFSDIDSELTPSESEASVYSDYTSASSDENPDDPFSVKRKAARRGEKALIAEEKERRRLEEEEEARKEEEEIMRRLREERVAEGRRATPTPEPTPEPTVIEDKDAEADDEGDKS